MTPSSPLLNRRRFFGTAAVTGATVAGSSLLAGGAVAAPDDVVLAGAQTVPEGNRAIQLYTLRRVMPNQARARVALARLARLGYTEVERAGDYGFTAANFKRVLDQNGLTAVSSHDGPSLDQESTTWQDSWRATCDYGAAVGQSYIGLAFQSGPHTPEYYRFLAERFTAAGQIAQEAGLQFFYHNHDFEFTNTDADGRPVFDILLEESDPDLVKFELDLYWMVAAGVNPIDYLVEDPSRFPLYHVKDKTYTPRGNGQPDWEDVGPGSIDFADIFAAGDTPDNPKHYVIEHDDPTISHPDDPEAEFKTAQAGIRFLQRVRWWDWDEELPGR